jgi:hypothetical protein
MTEADQAKVWCWVATSFYTQDAHQERIAQRDLVR